MNSTNKAGESASPNNQKVLEKMQHYRQYKQQHTNLGKSLQRPNPFSSFNMDQQGRVYPNSGRQLRQYNNNGRGFNPNLSGGTKLKFGYQGEQEARQDVRIIDRTGKTAPSNPEKPVNTKDMQEMQRMMSMMNQQQAKMNAISNGYYDPHRMGQHGMGQHGMGQHGPGPGMGYGGRMGGYQMGMQRPEGYGLGMGMQGSGSGAYSGPMGSFDQSSMRNTQETIPELNMEGTRDIQG